MHELPCLDRKAYLLVSFTKRSTAVSRKTIQRIRQALQSSVQRLKVLLSYIKWNISFENAFCQFHCSLPQAGLVMFHRIHHMDVDLREHDLDHTLDHDYFPPLMLLVVMVSSKGVDAA